MLLDLFGIEGFAVLLSEFLRSREIDKLNSCSTVIRTATFEFTSLSQGPGLVDSDSKVWDPENFVCVENPVQSSLSSYFFQLYRIWAFICFG